jgi:hypothetical protein
MKTPHKSTHVVAESVDAVFPQFEALVSMRKTRDHYDYEYQYLLHVSQQLLDALYERGWVLVNQNAQE